ncbi:MFS transporter [Pelosinus propionicus]|uniref:Sugar phosphate permease n=1 Tax=Pelosinus propionicus DSM 13327 TaxID=1123291 RepID=A0A1I4KJX1_9FIRM|nr:MFS transporter [Pelosinus propionicus]SFL78836.1 Sugar phosphate permease [Pelosinus propionicus DSM 13327]
MNNHAKIPNKRWIHIIPATIILYIMTFMDRMNISFAIAGGMREELGLSMTIAGLAAGLFFIGYMFLQIPGGYIAENKSAKKFITYTILGWGTLTVINGFVTKEWELLVIRFLLGFVEGGVYPAILVILGNWFPANEIGRANAMFMTSTSLAAIITNPISGWIVENYHWQWLFIVEGILSLLLICIWLPLIEDTPEKAKWLSNEEREYLVSTLKKEKESALEEMKRNHIKVSYKELLCNKNMWLLILIFNCGMIGAYGFNLWLPTILKSLTKTGMTQVGFLSTLPYITSIVGLYVIGYFSDKTQNRRFFTAFPLAFFGIGLWLSAIFSDNTWLSFGIMVITGLAIKSMPSSFWTMVPMLFPPGSIGAIRGFINALGNIGSFIGPYMVGSVTSAYGIKYGLYSLVGALLLGAVLTQFLPAKTAGK